MNSFEILKREIAECHIRAKSDETRQVLEYLQEFAESNLNNGWTSIDDELPYCHTVFSSDWYKDWHTNKYYPLQIATKDNMLRMAVFLEMKIQDFHGEKLFWLCDIENLSGKFVIHEISDDFLEVDEVKYWQPLPQPPKE